MGEDTCVLLVAAGVCGNLTVLDIVLGVSGIVQYQTKLGIQSFIDSGKGLPGCLFVDVGHDCEALRLDEDLAFLAFLGTHLLAVCIICAQEPVAVPCGLHDNLLHLVDLGLGSSCFVVHAQML